MPTDDQRSDLRARLVAAAERFANEIADAIEGTPMRKQTAARALPVKTARRKGPRWPADTPPPVVDEKTARLAEQALRRAGIILK